MPDSTQTICFTQIANGLKWGESSSQSVTFSDKDTLTSILESLVEQYGLAVEANGQYHLTPRQACNLILEMLPYLAKDGRMDWLMMKSKLNSPQLQGAIQQRDIPIDFDEKLKQALQILERHYQRRHGVIEDKKQVSLIEEFQQVLTQLPMTDDIKTRLLWVVQTHKGIASHQTIATQFDISIEAARKYGQRYTTVFMKAGWDVMNQDNHLLIRKA